MKCVVSRMVLPSLCLANRSQVALLAYGSMPDVGSSSTTILEPPIRAMPTLQHTWGYELHYKTTTSVVLCSNINLASRALHKSVDSYVGMAIKNIANFLEG